MFIENGSLAMVTVVDWPPHYETSTEYLLLTAALTSWAKITLFLIAALGYVLALMLWILRHLGGLARGRARRGKGKRF